MGELGVFAAVCDAALNMNLLPEIVAQSRAVSERSDAARLRQAKLETVGVSEL